MMLSQAKKNLTDREYMMVESELNKKGKEKWIAYLLWVLTSFFGGHRFYLGDIGYAVGMLFLNWATFGIWALVDLFLISKRVESKNEEIEMEIIKEMNMIKD